jgi:hypothetical protein
MSIRRWLGFHDYREDNRFVLIGILLMTCRRCGKRYGWR